MIQTPIKGQSTQLSKPLNYSFGQESFYMANQTKSNQTFNCKTQLQYVLRLIDIYEFKEKQNNDNNNSQTAQFYSSDKPTGQNQRKVQISTGRYSSSKVQEFGLDEDKLFTQTDTTCGLQISHNKLVQKFMTPVRKHIHQTQKRGRKQAQICSNDISQFLNQSLTNSKKHSYSNSQTCQIPLVESLIMNPQGEDKATSSQDQNLKPKVATKGKFSKTIKIQQHLILDENDNQQQDEIKLSHLLLVCLIVFGFLLLTI